MKRVGGTLAALLVAAAIGGCGGGSKADSAKEATTGAPSESSTASTNASGEGDDSKSAVRGTATTVKGGDSAGAAQDPGAAASGPGGFDEPDGSGLSSEPLPMAVELSSTCVRPGTPLTVTVRSVPEATIGYDTTWADGKTGWEAPNRGGTARGRTDDAGTWKNTSTVGADAPKGKATVEVIGADLKGRLGKATLEFSVSDALGKCP